MPKGWEHFIHGADIGVRGWGRSKEEAFTQAAMALTAVITRPESVNPREEVYLECQADDDEMLFVDWLNALVFEMATRGLLFSRFELQIKQHHLRARCWGEPIDIKRHHPAVEIKGATYTELKLVQQGGLWRVQTVVDV